MKTFKTNEIYKCRSICDYNCVWTYKVVKRTAATITIKDMDSKDIKTCRISKKLSEYFGSEMVHPMGNYSMAPSLWADRSIE